MTIAEKLTIIKNNPTKTILFKEGMFYKAYNQSAFMLKSKKYKITVKNIKNIDTEILSIGFPEKVFDKLKEEFEIETFENYNLCDFNEVYDETNYQNWRNEIIKDQPDCTKIENQQQIIEQIKNYPLATKTPIEVFQWIATIQNKLKL